MIWISRAEAQHRALYLLQELQTSWQRRTPVFARFNKEHVVLEVCLCYIRINGQFQYLQAGIGQTASDLC